MYRMTIAVVDNPTVIETDNRKLAGAIYALSCAFPKQFEVTVVTLANPKPTKFKNLPEQNKS